MKVLLRRSRTCLYYAGRGRPLAGIEGATNFARFERAVEAALVERLAGMEVVLHYDAIESEVCLPMTADLAMTAQRGSGRVRVAA